MTKPQSEHKSLGELVPEGYESKLPAWALRLTERKLYFVQEYLIDRNGRKAALRAGLSTSSQGAATIAGGLLRDPAVRAALDEIWAAEIAQRLVLRDRIMEELSTLAFYDPTDMVTVQNNIVAVTDTAKLTDDQRRAIRRVKKTTGKTISLEIEFHDKIKALDLLDQLNGIPRVGKTPTAAQNVDIKDSNVQFVVTPEEAKAL